MDLFLKYGINNQGGIQLVPITPLTFNYTGTEQTVNLNPGIYTFEAWGASSVDNAIINGVDQGTGRGAYTKGDIELTEAQTFHIYVGEGAARGRDSTSRNFYVFNGGASGGNFSASWSGAGTSGGGATDIRLNGGAWDNTTGLRSRIMVASGAAPSKNGGTLTGLTGWTQARGRAGTGGTQTAGGTVTGGNSGIFGRGGIGVISNPTCPNCNGAEGSGGGYYGGAGGWGGSCGCNPPASGSGGSGSSFISGHSGCNAITSAGSHTGQPNHFSGLIFTNTVMTAGLGEAHTWAGQTTGRETAATGHGKVVISGSQYQ